MLFSDKTLNNERVPPKRTRTEGRALLDSIRVLLVGMRGISGEIIRDTVAYQRDMEVAGELVDAHALASEAHEIRCDAVIIVSAENGDPPALPTGSLRLLTARPHVVILIVCGQGRRADIYGRNVERRSVQQPSPGALMDAVRVAVRAQG